MPKRAAAAKTDEEVLSETASATPAAVEEEEYIPAWFNKYIEYKFNLYDRAGM